MPENIQKASLILNESLEALGMILEYNLNDFPSHQHAIRVGEGCVLIGDKMGLKPDLIQRLYYAGMIHDIGKISIDQSILRKKGKLTDKEYTIIKGHSVHGSRIVATLPELNNMAYWIRWHHEKWDGTGYPDGLAGKEIPVAVQILSAVDCFDSLQTPRMDRDALNPDDAMEVLKRNRGKAFNPDVIDLIMEMHGEKSLLPGLPSEKFLSLKEKYVNRPLVSDEDLYLKYYGLVGLYPILRLFAMAIDAKHHDTKGHSIRVSILSKFLAGEMGLSTEDMIKIEIAGLLHDAGKVSIPNEILDKPEKPSSDEWDLIKAHPVLSSEIMKKITHFNDISSVVYSHHVWEDGRGYPENSGKNSILSQIISVADAFDAITTDRSYRRGSSITEAYMVIKNGIGTQFNEKAGNVLINTSPKFIAALFDMHMERSYL